MERIEEAIEAGLLARALEGPGGEVEASLVRTPTPLLLSPGELDIEIVDLDRPGSGIRQVQLAFIVEGKKEETRTYSVRVDHQTHGLVAKRALNPGDVVTPDDLTEGLIPVGNQIGESGVVFDPERILGTKVLHPIAEGSPITEEDVEREPLKIRGDPVTLIQRVGKVHTTAPGELLEDAVKIGQPIRVKKSNSRKTFVGRLLSPWEVEVR
jgi:flagella basal body P-ring formation protein FlgA